MAAWDKLPNAALIDQVLASVRQHPELWHAECNAARDAARDVARVAAWESARDTIKGAAWVSAADATRNAAWNAVRDASGHVAWGAAWGAARDAIAALVAFDESADILRLPPDAVRAMAAWGVPAAVLLAPYIHLIQQEE